MILCSHWLTEKILCSDWLHHLPHRLLDTEIILNFTKNYFYGKYLSFKVDLWENTQTDKLTCWHQYNIDHIFIMSHRKRKQLVSTQLCLLKIYFDSQKVCAGAWIILRWVCNYRVYRKYTNQMNILWNMWFVQNIALFFIKSEIHKQVRRCGKYLVRCKIWIQMRGVIIRYSYNVGNSIYGENMWVRHQKYYLKVKKYLVNTEKYLSAALW